MVIKVYIGIWAAFALVVLGAAATGNLTGEFGFFAGTFLFGLIFLGMLSVIPLTLAPKPHKAHATATVKIKAGHDRRGQAANYRGKYAEIPGGFHGKAMPL